MTRDPKASRNRKLKLEDAPITIQHKVAELHSKGIPPTKINERLRDMGYHTTHGAIRRFLTKKNVQLTRMVFGTEDLQSQVAKEYSDVVKNFAQTSKDLMFEFNKIKNHEISFKDEFQRIRAMVEIGKLMKDNVEFANKLLATKITAEVDNGDILDMIHQISKENIGVPAETSVNINIDSDDDEEDI